MWVLSQDRSELVDVSNKRILICKNKIYMDLCIANDNVPYILLGEYENEKVATKVFKDILVALRWDKITHDMPTKEEM